MVTRKQSRSKQKKRKKVVDAADSVIVNQPKTKKRKINRKHNVSPNDLGVNGLNTNGLSSNGLSSNGFNPNGAAAANHLGLPPVSVLLTLCVFHYISTHFALTHFVTDS